jgi:hypothetical protein
MAIKRKRIKNNQNNHQVKNNKRRMKTFFSSLLLLILFCHTGFSQNDFTGIVKYKISTDGNPAASDSMTAIFDKQKVKVILYLPDSKNAKTVSETIFIDDLKDKKSFTLNTKNKTYKVDTLNNPSPYIFINIWKIEPSNNSALCLHYRADSTKLDRSKISRVDCLSAIDYLNTLIREYSFLGVQPLIVDNRIVMEFIITRKDGVKERTSVTDITRMEKANSYFDLSGYKLAK